MSQCDDVSYAPSVRSVCVMSLNVSACGSRINNGTICRGFNIPESELLIVRQCCLENKYLSGMELVRSSLFLLIHVKCISQIEIWESVIMNDGCACKMPHLPSKHKVLLLKRESSKLEEYVMTNPTSRLSFPLEEGKSFCNFPDSEISVYISYGTS